MTVLVTLALNMNAWGDTERLPGPIPEDGEFFHILEGHTFQPLYLLPRPFSDSTISLSNGIGGRTLFSGDEDLKLVIFAPKLDLQFRVWKGLAVSFGVAGTVVAGVNAVSALQYGASTGYTWIFGALYEAYRHKEDVVSVGLVVNRPHTFSVSPLSGLIVGLSNIVSGSEDNFVISEITTQFTPTARWAHAFSPVFGLQSTLGFRVSDGEESGSTGTRGIFGVGVDADLEKWFEFPLTVSFAYSRNQIVTATASNSDTFSFGVFQASKSSFSVGAEMGWVRAADKDTTAGVISLRTYFD